MLNATILPSRWGHVFDEAMSLSSSPSTLQGSIITSLEINSREESLALYVTPKVHCDIRNHEWSHIVVKGVYTRCAPARVTDNEKKGQLFNWQRPTATWLDHETLQINCFPGAEYVEHYARVIATYLSLHNRHNEAVTMIRPEPSDALDIFRQSNLPLMGAVDLVIIGDVHCFRPLQARAWSNGQDFDTSLFRWRKTQSANGFRVAVLGCEASLWGNISGQLVRALKEVNDIRYCFYIAKAGSLRPKDVPNTLVATGSKSLFQGEVLTWNNFICSNGLPLLAQSVQEGIQITVLSPLLETKDWLQESSSKGADWVDCEVGHIAKAVNELSISFAYMHVLSDNVAQSYDHNISNEDEAEPEAAREHLFEKLWEILVGILNIEFEVDIAKAFNSSE